MVSQAAPERLTRAEIEEALFNLTATLRKMPNYWIDRRAAYHAKIDALLDQWEQAAA